MTLSLPRLATCQRSLSIGGESSSRAWCCCWRSCWRASSCCGRRSLRPLRRRCVSRRPRRVGSPRRRCTSTSSGPFEGPACTGCATGRAWPMRSRARAGRRPRRRSSSSISPPGSQTESRSSCPARGSVAAVAPTPGGGAASGPVHLNSATLEQLDALPGVGPVTAQKILDYRQKHGAFGSVDELDAISGIGPARLETLRDLVAP